MYRRVSTWTTFAAVLTLGLTALAVDDANAGRKTHKYYFELTKIDLRDGVPAEVEPQLRHHTGKSIGAHARLLAALPEGAPDPDEAPEKFKRFLAKKRISAYKVNLEVLSYSHDVEPARNGQFLTVSIALRMFGETVPDRVMAFSGEGSATIKLEIGKRLRKSDTKAANHEALEIAISKALEESIAKLDQPPKKRRKK